MHFILICDTRQLVKKKTKHSSNYREAFHGDIASYQLVTPASRESKY